MPVKVTGFTSNQIRAIDVANANQPIELDGTIDGTSAITQSALTVRSGATCWSSHRKRYCNVVNNRKSAIDIKQCG